MFRPVVKSINDLSGESALAEGLGLWNIAAANGYRSTGMEAATQEESQTLRENLRLWSVNRFTGPCVTPLSSSAVPCPW